MINKYFLIILILLFPFGQLTRIPVLGGSGALYLHDILIAIYLAIYFGKLPEALSKKVINSNKGWFLFVAACVLSLLLALQSLPISEVLVSSLYLVRLIAYVAFFYVVSGTNKLDITPYIISNMVLTLALCYGQYFLLPRLEPLFAAGWDRHLNRMAGPWIDTGFTGIILSLQTIFLTQLTIKTTERSKRMLYALLLILLGLAVLLTYSRSSFLALVIGIGSYLILNRNKKHLVVLIALFMIGILCIPRNISEGTNLMRTSTIEARLGNWREGVKLFVQKPIFGCGFNTLRYVKRNLGLEAEKWNISHAAAGLDNSLLFILVTTGLLGFAAFLVCVGTTIRRYDDNPLILSSVLTIGAHGMFANSWFYPWVILWLGTLLVLNGGVKSKS